MDEGAKAVGKSLFYQTWGKWNKYLKFRNIGQGKRCRICAQLDEERLKADPCDKAEICARKFEHLKGVMQDRKVDTRTSLLAKDDAKLGDSGVGRLLKLSIDGMDQAPGVGVGTGVWADSDVRPKGREAGREAGREGVSPVMRISE